MQSFTPSILTGQIIKWVVESVDPSATVQAIHQLKGATSSTLHSITLLIKQVTRTVVLRQFDNKKWLETEADVALHEARSLLHATQNGLPTPGLIAYDETGKACGMPAVLMSHLEGEVILKPYNIDVWLDELAKTLVQIHAVSAEDFRWNYSSYMDIKAFDIPSWSNSPELWKVIISKIKQPAHQAKRCFIHRDYHPTNVLWHMNEVCGVVDWVNACVGPAGIDVGHCRVNLTMLFDVETADKFLLAYKKHAGSSFHYDVYWDLISLIDILEEPPKVYQGWVDFGVMGLTNQLMRERVDQYTASLAKLLAA
jgi:aminoglycoside phosphotransferase (APT) family kinase protein